MSKSCIHVIIIWKKRAGLRRRCARDIHLAASCCRTRSNKKSAWYFVGKRPKKRFLPVFKALHFFFLSPKKKITHDVGDISYMKEKKSNHN